MDEYISRNELLKDVHSNVAEAHNERCAQLLEAILNAPTADVVPRSELEISQHLLKDAWKRIEELDELCGELQRKYDLAVAEREANVKGFAEELEKANDEIERLKYNLKAVLEEIPETKREFASEIFAEIENLFLNNHIESFKNFHDNWHYRFKVNMMTEIAELKKKYAGGNDDRL